MIYVSKDIQKCTLSSTHHDITDFEVEGIERNKKSQISEERKILKLCLKNYILKSYYLIAEVTF